MLSTLTCHCSLLLVKTKLLIGYYLHFTIVVYIINDLTLFNNGFLGMASATSWSEEDFSCSICLDVFNSPVTTPCGHNFCRACITVFWDDIVQYKCPVCNELFHTRPVLRVNTFISGMVDQFRSSVRVKEQPCVEPGEVPCDVCTGTQLKAVNPAWCVLSLTARPTWSHIRESQS